MSEPVVESSIGGVVSEVDGVVVVLVSTDILEQVDIDESSHCENLSGSRTTPSSSPPSNISFSKSEAPFEVGGDGADTIVDLVELSS